MQPSKPISWDEASWAGGWFHGSGWPPLRHSFHSPTRFASGFFSFPEDLLYQPDFWASKVSSDSLVCGLQGKRWNRMSWERGLWKTGWEVWVSSAEHDLFPLINRKYSYILKPGNKVSAHSVRFLHFMLGRRKVTRSFFCKRALKTTVKFRSGSHQSSNC